MRFCYYCVLLNQQNYLYIPHITTTKYMTLNFIFSLLTYGNPLPFLNLGLVVNKIYHTKHKHKVEKQNENFYKLNNVFKYERNFKRANCQTLSELRIFTRSPNVLSVII